MKNFNISRRNVLKTFAAAGGAARHAGEIPRVQRGLGGRVLGRRPHREFVEVGLAHHDGTGGKARLLGISKRGDTYLRTMLIHGARAVVRTAARYDDALSRWVHELAQRRGIHKATVAVANKMARQMWAELAYA